MSKIGPFYTCQIKGLFYTSHKSLSKKYVIQFEVRTHLNTRQDFPEQKCTDYSLYYSNTLLTYLTNYYLSKTSCCVVQSFLLIGQNRQFNFSQTVEPETKTGNELQFRFEYRCYTIIQCK